VIRASFVMALFVVTLATSTPNAAAEDATAKTTETFLMLQEENTVIGKEVDPSLTLVFLRPLARHFGVFANSITSKTYGVAYAGPAYILDDRFSVGLGAGLEQAWLIDPKAKTSARVGLIASLTLEHFAAFGILETGGSGPWYRLYATLRPMRWLGFGVFSDAAYGMGMYGDVIIPKTPIQIYGAAPTDTETGETTGIFGARLYL